MNQGMERQNVREKRVKASDAASSAFANLVCVFQWPLFMLARVHSSRWIMQRDQIISASSIVTRHCQIC